MANTHFYIFKRNRVGIEYLGISESLIVKLHKGISSARENHFFFVLAITAHIIPHRAVKRKLLAVS